MVAHQVLPLGAVGSGCRAGMGLPASPRLSPASLTPPVGTSGKTGRIWCLFSTWARSLAQSGAAGPSWGATWGDTFALVLAWTLVSRLPSAFAGDSGGHFNPAVSLAAMLIGGLNLVMLLPYWISQLCGGLIGAALAKVGDPHGGWGEGSGESEAPHFFPLGFSFIGIGWVLFSWEGGLWLSLNTPCSVSVWT